MREKDPYKSGLLTFGRIELFKIAVRNLLYSCGIIFIMIFFLICGITDGDDFAKDIVLVFEILFVFALVSMAPAFLFSVVCGVLFNVFIRVRKAVFAAVTLFVYTITSLGALVSRLTLKCLFVFQLIENILSDGKTLDGPIDNVDWGLLIFNMVSIIIPLIGGILFLALHILMIAKLIKIAKGERKREVYCEDMYIE